MLKRKLADLAWVLLAFAAATLLIGHRWGTGGQAEGCTSLFLLAVQKRAGRNAPQWHFAGPTLAENVAIPWSQVSHCSGTPGACKAPPIWMGGFLLLYPSRPFWLHLGP